MNLIGRLFVNSHLWNFVNRKFIMPIILNNLLRDDYKRVLDLGCGVGYTSKEIAFKLKNAEVFGIDYDKRQIRKAKKRNKSGRIKFMVGDARNLDLRDNYFDAVFVFDAMHHVENYEDAASEIYRILKRNGDLYVLDIDRKFFNALMMWLDNTQSLFSRKEFIYTLKRYRFKVIKDGRRPVFYGKRSEFFYVVARKG